MFFASRGFIFFCLIYKLVGKNLKVQIGWIRAGKEDVDLPGFEIAWVDVGSIWFLVASFDWQNVETKPNTQFLTISPYVETSIWEQRCFLKKRGFGNKFLGVLVKECIANTEIQGVDHIPTRCLGAWFGQSTLVDQLCLDSQHTFKHVKHGYMNPEKKLVATFLRGPLRVQITFKSFLVPCTQLLPAGFGGLPSVSQSAEEQELVQFVFICYLNRSCSQSLLCFTVCFFAFWSPGFGHKGLSILGCLGDVFIFFNRSR